MGSGLAICNFSWRPSHQLLPPCRNLVNFVDNNLAGTTISRYNYELVFSSRKSVVSW